MFSLLESNPLIISFVISIVSVVPVALVIFNLPPVVSSVSLTLYFTFVGNVSIATDCIVFVIVIGSLAVPIIPLFAVYFKVNVLLTLLSFPYSEIVGFIFNDPPSFSVITADVIGSSFVVPSVYVTVIFPPVKSIWSPWLYSVFVGGVIVTFDISFSSLTLKFVVNVLPFV